MDDASAGFSCKRCGGEIQLDLRGNVFPVCDQCRECPECKGGGKVIANEQVVRCSICYGRGWLKGDVVFAFEDTVEEGNDNNVLPAFEERKL